MSLEKKLKDLRNALSTDHHLPQCCEKNLILLIDTQLEELDKVADKIRNMDDWGGFISQKEVWGLLVEDDYLECEKDDPTEEGEKK